MTLATAREPDRLSSMLERATKAVSTRARLGSRASPSRAEPSLSEPEPAREPRTFFQLYSRWSENMRLYFFTLKKNHEAWTLLSL